MFFPRKKKEHSFLFPLPVCGERIRVRGENILKTKSRNRLFYFFYFNFLHNLKTSDVVGLLTPHVSANLTTVKFSKARNLLKIAV
jgi:hypothetical protein